MSDIPTVPPPEATPTYSGFLSWVRNVMGVPTQALTDDSPTLTWALNVATLVVNKGLIVTGMYALACYNLGGDNLVNFAQDVGSPPFNYPGTKTPYWAYLEGSSTRSASCPAWSAPVPMSPPARRWRRPSSTPATRWPTCSRRKHLGVGHIWE